MTITVIRDTVVCLDENNNPLRDIILWLDKRSVESERRHACQEHDGL